MSNVSNKENTLKSFMKISALVYLVTGIAFALFPNLILRLINLIGSLFDMPGVPLSDGKVWLALAFSMMMTLTVLCFFVQDDVKRYGKFVIPLLIAKFSSSIISLFYFKFVSPSFGYLLILLVDGSIFLATLIIWIIARDKAYKISESTTSSELTPNEKQFKTFMLISAIVYFIAGLAFAIIPNQILSILNVIGSAIGLPDVPLSDGKFWLVFAFSMMMTVTALCLFVYYDVAENKNYTVPVFMAKLASSVAGLLYFLFAGWCFAYLAVFLIDGAIFAITLVFYLKANEKWLIKQTAYLRKKPVPAKITPETTVVVEKGSDKFQALRDVLEKTNFDSILNDYFEKSGKTKEEFSIVIKPNFMFSHNKKDNSTFTDPELVETLINRIVEKGFSKITIVEAPSTYGNYYANREVLTVAKYLGYRTDKNYKIVDLSKEMVPHYYNFDKLGPELMLGHHFVGATWKDADFRVSFAKNKTHCFCNYTLTLKNIYGTLPMQNKLKHYHTRREYDWATICTIADFPVHFGLIDAFYSGDGAFGVITCPHPKRTKTIIGGENLIAVDWVGATKMGLDPERPDIGRFLPLSIQAFGFPEKINWVGDRTKYDKWKKCPQFIVLFLDIVEELYSFSNWWFAVLSAQDKYFTFIVKSRSAKIARKILAPVKRFLFPYDAL
jgi:uncharacterized protein (DUF362 family)